MSVIVLTRRVCPQPVPHLNPGGDCGACVLAGLLEWSIPDVYQRLLGGAVEPVNRDDMRRALWSGYSLGLVDRIADDAPLCWEVYDPHRTFGSPAHLQGGPWFAYVRMALDAGYYGLAEVDHRRGGPLGQGKDHWVLICGAREVPPPPPGGAVAQDVLVSCSSKSTPDEEWVDARAFLRDRGGFNLLLARPTP